MKFPLHQKTLDLLKGLEGIEIGAAAHNPFGVNSKNVAPKANYEFYSKEQIEIAGVAADIDIDGLADAIPIPDHSVDFVLSSHVVEHLPDLVAAFNEWSRVIKPGGYVVMIVPQRDALKSDARRELSTLEEVLAAQGRKSGGPKTDKHHWVFTSASLVSIIEKLDLGWTHIGTEDPDSKVRNGFWLAYRVGPERPKSILPKPYAPEHSIAIVIPTLDQAKGELAGALALASAGCEARIIVVSGEPRGFTKTVNEGIAQTTTEDICVLNDDIKKFQPNWLLDLSKGLYSNPYYGIIGPGGKSATAPASHGRPGMKGYEECEQVSYWCVLLKREMLDKLGVLDERFIHYCSDNEYNIRARKAGWRVVWDRSVYLEHEHHGSGLRREWLKLDQETFRKVSK